MSSATLNLCCGFFGPPGMPVGGSKFGLNSKTSQGTFRVKGVVCVRENE